MSTVQLLSPAELAYLHASLSLNPPVRPDGRAATQFRPLTAETGFLPGTNGSARVCFSDGSEAIVGVKAEIERTPQLRRTDGGGDDDDPSGPKDGELVGEGEDGGGRVGRPEWVEMAVEIPGARDDDAGTVFLASMLSEALLADGRFAQKLWINRRFHWKLYLDVLLISPPLSYPLPLLSLTTHLALLATRLPRLKSEGDEDPLFDDDWEASTYLYPPKAPASSASPSSTLSSRPPITLLVISVGDNIIFDPCKEELAVADAALAVSVAETRRGGKKTDSADPSSRPGRELGLLAIRTIDPPSRLTPPGVPNASNPATAATAAPMPGAPTKPQQSAAAKSAADGQAKVEGVWKPPVGGAKFAVLNAMVQKVLERGGVADEVLDGLDGVALT